MNQLHAPWRMEYLRTLERASEGRGCFLCDAAGASDDDERRGRMVLWTTPQSVVLLNIFPYTNGHLLVAPRRHVAELEDLDDAELSDLQRQTVRGVRLLRRAISPQAFNVGINLGRAAGAGVPGHLHQHVVPRWNGDVNFMSVVGEVRVVPQALPQLYEELRRVEGA